MASSEKKIENTYILDVEKKDLEIIEEIEIITKSILAGNGVSLLPIPYSEKKSGLISNISKFFKKN